VQTLIFRLYACSKMKGVGLVFVGEGAMKSQVEAMAAGCRAVRFLPFRPAGEILWFFLPGICTSSREERSEGVVVPSKMYPTLAAGRPVLGVAPEECDVVAHHSRLGVRPGCRSGRSKRRRRALRGCCTTRNRYENMGLRAREIANSYDRVKQLKISQRQWRKLSRMTKTGNDVDGKDNIDHGRISFIGHPWQIS